MNILLNGTQTTFATSDLPALITGAPKHGASHFSLCLMVDLFRRGHKVLVLSAFYSVEDDFKRMLTSEELDRFESVETDNSVAGKQLILVNPGNAAALTAVLSALDDLNDRIVLVKNVERFSLDAFDAVRNLPLLVIAGDADVCPLVDELAKIDFATKIFFSPSIKFRVDGMPTLEKYQGFAIGTEKNGIVALKD